MASAQANAERLVSSQQRIQSAISKLSAQSGVPVPPPPPKTEQPDARVAYEMERVANFMAQLAGLPEAGGSAPRPVAGTIGDGYVHQKAEAARQRAEEGDEEDEPDDEPGQPGGPQNAAEEAEPEFLGKPLSAYDRYPDEASLEKVPGIGEARAKEIMTARRKRDAARK